MNEVSKKSFEECGPGLSQETITKICRVFEEYAAINQVILYGSRAKGNYRKGSDIDLVLVGEEISLSQLVQIENKIDDLLLPYKLDISIFHKIENPDLIDHIKRVGITIYNKSI